MLKQSFNNDWTVIDGSHAGMLDSMMGASSVQPTPVTLPHDAMVHEKRSPEAPGANQVGFFPGGIYHYTRTFEAPEDWANKRVIFEFEGVACNARVLINGSYAGGWSYEYTNFYVDATNFLKIGASNEIKVIANNSPQPASRWYSGSGIYRPVNLYVGSPLRIDINGVKITPRDITEDTAIVEVNTTVVNDSLANHNITISVEIQDAEGNIVAVDNNPVTIYRQSKEHVSQRIFLDEPHRWNLDDPYLYKAVVKVIDGVITSAAPAADLLANGTETDRSEETFGIRTITVDPKHGFRLNGHTVMLAGTCIHHDNGIIGAATIQAAENKRCREMKAAGFNCIRSAHHPMSKEMLAACDKYGMLVMDELSDMWTQSKNINDYSQFFPDNWKTDVLRMVEKDYNHPCVILYSTGNEILEAGSPAGAKMNREISNEFKRLDDTRFTTAAANGLLAVMDSIQAILTDLVENQHMDPSKMAPSGDPLGGGSDDGSGDIGTMNAMMSLIGTDEFATHPIMTRRISEFANATDLLGYNYMTARHIQEHKLNPNHVVIGTETYPADIYRLWDVMKKHPWAIGDFTWTGYDYLGEAGCGIFYYDGTINFSAHFPDIASYVGDINLIGYRRPISYYREIVFGKRKTPYLAVLRMDKDASKASKTSWMWKNNIASWTWDGFEGQTASVDVYSVSDEVEMFLNGKSLGKKPCGDANQYIATYEVPYEAGELKAVGYTNGSIDGECVLKTASAEVHLAAAADRTKIHACTQDASFVTVRLEDPDGTENLQARKNVTVKVEGPAVLQGYGSADPSPNPSLNYDLTTWPTFDGEVMACIRSTGKAGNIRVTFSAEGCKDAVVEITAE